jgi:catechol 2,3-dioxygenase-like lactoylglutathione lyase family enzyme
MKILETAIYAVDLEETARFYEQVLGLERIVSYPDRHVFFRLEDGVLLIFNPQSTVLPSKDPKMPVPSHGAIGPGHVCFAATAAQIEYWVRKLSDALIEIEADFTWPAGGRSIYFRDPAGNSIEFAEPRIWGFE